jgi:spore germination protein GerM
MASRRRKKSKSSNTGCLIWLAGFSIVVVLFAINYGTIKTTLEKTKFFDALKSRSTTTTTIPGSTTTVHPQRGQGVSTGQPGKANPPPTTSNNSGTVTSLPWKGTVTVPGSNSISGTNGSAITTNSPALSNPGLAGKTMVVSLYFVSISDDGTITRKEVKRTIPVSDSPLGDALAALVSGPTEPEIRDKLISLIPSGTKIRGINVRASTALIDFNDSFTYNHYGVEGYAAQLKQVVYTATSFSGIQDVQIMIDGKIRDYLGSEGVYIGKPLSRNSFQ